LLSFPVFAQVGATTGNIAGKVTDDAGLPIRSATISIKDKSTQTSVTLRTDAQGEFSSEQVPSGHYSVQMEAKNYRSIELKVDVKSGATSRAEGKLVPIGSAKATVLTVIPGSDAKTIPLHANNSLEITQTSPAVQVIDGASESPNKVGVFADSINDRSGKTTRLELDGISILDETHGTITQNVAISSVKEVDLTRALPDLSTPLAGAGAANIITKSGSDDLHGNAYFDYRNGRVGTAAFPGGLDLPFNSSQYGGSVGGAIIKDKAFFFIGADGTYQGGDSPVPFSYPFNLLSGGYHSPYHDTSVVGRVDDRINPTMNAFFRASYNKSNDVWSVNNFSPYKTDNTGQNYAGGVDFTRDIYTHSIRGAYTRFSNTLSPPGVSGLLDPLPGINLSVGTLQTGPSAFAPQKTIQSNWQAKYEGSRPFFYHGPHTLQFGGELDRISVAALTSGGSLGPTISGAASLTNIQNIISSGSSPFAALISGDPAGATDNPLNYPVGGITINNGQQFSSENGAFGYAGGGHHDTRLSGFIGDVWKFHPNLTISGGVNYVHDSGRTDSDQSSVTCSQINTGLFPAPPCTGSALVLDQFGFIPGLGKSVRQPSLDFAPQLGVAWDPGANGRTIIRSGIGLFYDNNLFNNTLMSRAARRASGQFAGTASLCPSGSLLFPNGTVVSSSDGLDIATQICGQPIGNVATAVSDLQAAYQAAAAGTSFNPYFVGNTLSTPGTLFAPNYRSPRVLHMSAGLQREIHRGQIFSVDFVRDVGTHFPLGVDTNLVGSSGHISVPAALLAISRTILSNPLTNGVCPLATFPGSSSFTAVNCYLSHVPNANITDFAVNGLDSGNAYCGGYACSLLGKAAAFPGINPLVGSNVMYFPVARSSYNGLQLGYRTSLDRPFRAVTHLDLAFSYTWSRYKDTVPIDSSSLLSGQDVLTRAQNYLSTNRALRPSSLDRTHQFTLSPNLFLTHGLRLSAIGHLASPLPQTLYLPQANGGGDAGEIFRSDTTGDGTVGDLLPGTRGGDYGRGSSNLVNVIAGYNSLFSRQITPAGGQLISSQLLTLQQVENLGAYTPLISTPPANYARPTWLRNIDVQLAWPLHLRENVVIEPNVTVFNIMNIANFNSPANPISGVLDGSPGHAINNSTTACGIVLGVCTAQTNRVVGSGAYELGAPRQMQFGVKVNF
jgi:Carboxypeptidase regulatory-like domain